MSPSAEPRTGSTGSADTLIFSGPGTFIKAPHLPCTVEAIRNHGVKAAFLGLPFDQATALRSGMNYGPKGLRNLSEMYLSYMGDFDIDLFEEFNLADVGDVPVVPANAERSRAAMQEYVGRVLDSGALPLICGGDDSTPIPTARALSERTSGNVGFLHVDAHIDAADHLQGEYHTNWSPVARIIENHNVDPENVALVGIRGILNPKEQHEFVRNQGIGVHTMRSVVERGIDAVMADALEQVTSGTEAFYVNWDVDAIDCSAAPGTNGPEPGGLTPREALRAVEHIGAAKPAIFGVSEYLPAYDSGGITGRLICHLYFHLLGSYATRGAHLSR